MGLDIYFREDIRNAVDSLELAAMYQDPAIQVGWLACLDAVRAAFGLEQVAQQETLAISARSAGPAPI